MTAWTEEDEGVLRAYNTRDYLRRNGQIQSLSVASPLRLEPGENCLAIATARLSKWQVDRYVPEDTTYFRLKYSFAKDPLVAPFMWIIFLPFNLLSMLISRTAHTKTTTRWFVRGEGSLVVTDRALLQAIYGGQLRIPWNQVSDVTLSYSPPGINLKWHNESYFIETPTIGRLGLVMMMRFLALGNRGDDMTVPDSLIDRARALRKL
jgi:hypothetical protein